MRTGIAFVDLSDPQWTDGLAKVLSRHRQVRYLVSGHAHMALQGTLAGVPVYVAPSTAFQLVSRLGVDEPPSKVDVPGPIPLHYWDGQSFLTTTYPAFEIDEADRLDALSGMSWEDLKKFMSIKVNAPDR